MNKTSKLNNKTNNLTNTTSITATDTTDTSPKYLKKKESNTSKAKKKSKHKHQYEECLLQYHFKNSENTHVTLKSYCTVCGKIGNKFAEEKSIVTDYRKVVDTPIGKCYTLISEKELYEKYHNKMPVFFINDLSDNYVCLSNQI